MGYLDPGALAAKATLTVAMLAGYGLNCGGFSKLRVRFGGPNNKDYSIWGSILGFPYFGKLPCCV